MDSQLTRRQFGKVITSTIGVNAVSGVLPFAQPPGVVRRPNIVFICSDEHDGRQLLGGSGEAVPVRTPNLARLASKGVWFRNAYTAQPVCAAGRAAMMTGRFASDVGSYCNATPFDGRVPTWGGYLRQAGYYTWATGKLDLCPKAAMDFVQVNTSNGHYENPDITSLWRRPLCYRVDEKASVNGKVGDGSRKHDLDVTEAGLNFLRTEANHLDKPWVAYLGILAPHPDYVAPQKYWDLYPPEQVRVPNIPPGYLENDLHLVYRRLRDFKMVSTPIPEERIRRARSGYYAEISEVDDYVGCIVDELEKTDGLKDTLVIYTSDHGDMLGSHGIWRKNVLLEGAARVPLIMSGAGLPQGKIVDTPVSHLDMVATMLDSAGMSIPNGLRGHSLLPMLRKGRADNPKFVYAESHGSGKATGSFMIRRGEWKYIYFSWYDNNLLFDLNEDPEELNNLAGRQEFTSIKRELHEILRSLVDPDAVTEQAFDRQHQLLQQMVQKNPPDQFCQRLISRLGPGQAIALTKKHYPKWKPVLPIKPGS